VGEAHHKPDRYKNINGIIFYFKEAGSGCPVLPSQRLMLQAFEGTCFTPLSLPMLLFTCI